MLTDESSGAMSYLLADLDSRASVLVDARAEDVPVLTAMLHEHGLQLSWLLHTHEHDLPKPFETSALAALGAPRVGPASAESSLVFGHELLRVMATPGHTTGCLSFLWRDRLFCGDLLSVDACPSQPRPMSPEAMWDSATRQVFTLPRETLLFCSHARHGRAVSSVLEQQRWHPWLGRTTRDEFLAIVRAPAAAESHRHVGSSLAAA